MCVWCRRCECFFFSIFLFFFFFEELLMTGQVGGAAVGV